MKDHVILCGIGTTSIHVVDELYRLKKAFVAIEDSLERIEELKNQYPGIIVIQGDGTNESVLEAANIGNASTLVATLSNDKDNLFLTFTARMLNPKVTIIARAIDYGLQSRLKKAGADYIISPNFIGGQTISSQILRPNVHSFLQNMMRAEDKNLNIHEIIVPVDSPLIGKTLKEAEIGKETQLNIIAYAPECKDEKYVYNPSGDLVINANSILLFIGTPEQKQRLEKFIS